MPATYEGAGGESIGRETASGFLRLEGAGPLRLARAGEHAGPQLSFGSVGRPPWFALDPGAEDASPPDWTTYRSAERGYTVSFPASWQRAERPVSRLTDPLEILSLGTFPLRHRPTNCDAFAGSAREDLGPSDAFLTILERGFDPTSEWPGFPPRRERFSPTPENAKGAEPACGDRPGTDGRWLNFTGAGRHFHVQIVLGPDATSAVRRDAWRILDSLRLDPAAKPDWPASP